MEDRRTQGGAKRVAFGGGLLGLVVVVVAMLFGADPRPLMRIVQNAQRPAAQEQQPAGVPPANDEMAQFVSVVLRDTEDVWGQLFEQMGSGYRQPKLVLFRDSVSSACGFQRAAVGPFYSPLDEKVYLDLSLRATGR